MKEEQFNKRAYEILKNWYGDIKWWRNEDPFEVAIGAILTQRTLWKYVERSVENLKKENIFSPSSILQTEDKKLANLIKPSGFPQTKARKIKNLCKFIIEELEGNIEKLKEFSLIEAREKLLSVKGIGMETADSILCYGLRLPVLVVDSYTYRIYSRHSLAGENCSYLELQSIASKGLAQTCEVLSEFHALLVQTAKDFCKKKDARCRISGNKGCPLEVLFDE